MTPPDPQLKGAWYPGVFNPRTYRVKTRFQNAPNLPFKCNLRRYSEGASDQRIYWSTSDDCGHSWRAPEVGPYK